MHPRNLAAHRPRAEVSAGPPRGCWDSPSLKGQMVGGESICAPGSASRILGWAVSPKIVVLELTAGHTASTHSAFVADRISDVVVYRDRDSAEPARCAAKGRPRRLIDFDQIISQKELGPLWPLSPARSIESLLDLLLGFGRNRGQRKARRTAIVTVQIHRVFQPLEFRISRSRAGPCAQNPPDSASPCPPRELARAG